MKKRGRMGKKAQSKIITVVLLILIVLVAIAIVWTVVANIIEGADLDIEPVILGANIKSFTLDVDQTISLVQVQRSRGKGDVVGLKFIFEDKNGKSYVSEDKNISNKLIELQTRTFRITNDTLGIKNFTDMRKVSVAYFYEKEGDEKLTSILDSESVDSGSGGGGTIIPTCESQGGITCDPTESCVGTPVSASNSNKCCQGICLPENCNDVVGCEGYWNKSVCEDNNSYCGINKVSEVCEWEVGTGCVNKTCDVLNPLTYNDSLWCNGEETCVVDIVMWGNSPSCGDAFSCTEDSCNETSNACETTLVNSRCSDLGACFYINKCDPLNPTNYEMNTSDGCGYNYTVAGCDDEKVCTENDVCSLGVCGGTDKVCPPITGIADCKNPIDDGLDFTWDFRAAGSSVCDSVTGICSSAPVTSTCNKTCDATVCEVASDCPCPENDCIDNNLHIYPVNGNCLTATTCSCDIGTEVNEACEAISVSVNDLSCIQTTLDSCQNLTVPDMVYTLTTDLIGGSVIPLSANGCFDIQAENITLDCGGKKIINSSLATSGVYSNSSNTTIMNCDINMSYINSEESIGIELVNANNSYIFNNTLNGNYRGLILFSTSYTIIENNTANSNWNVGIGIDSSHYNNLTGNTANSNLLGGDSLGGVGIWISRALNNGLINNKLNSNKFNIKIERSSNSVLINNSLWNSSENNLEILGITAMRSENNVISGGMINLSGEKLINLIYAKNNKFENIKLYNADVDSDAIYLSVSENNVFDNLIIYSPNSNNSGIHSRSPNTTIINSNITMGVGTYSSGLGYGIFLDNAHESNIINNTLNYQGRGLVLNPASNVNIRNNIMINNSHVGIGMVNADNNNITGNVIIDNSGDPDKLPNTGYGIWLVGDSNSNNNITDNIVCGNLHDFNCSTSTGTFGIGNKFTIVEPCGAWPILDTDYELCPTPNMLDDCADLIVEGETYTLTQSFTASRPDCFVFLEDNITLEGNGHVVTYPGIGDEGVGAVNRKNITIKNIKLVNFVPGISFSGVENSTIINVESTCPDVGCNNGLSLMNSDYNEVRDSNFSNNDDYGMQGTTSNYNIFINNTVYDNNGGIYLSGSLYNNLTKNIVRGSENTGIYLETGTSNNFLTENEVYNNGYGIFVGNSPDNILYGNLVSDNSEVGIWIAGSDYTNLTNNVANNNTNNGISVSNSFYNDLIENQANNNSNNGIYLASSNHTNLTNNVANNNGAIGIYLSKSFYNDLIGNQVNYNRDEDALYRDGIHLYLSDYNNLIDNIAINNSLNGISLYDSRFNTLRQNNLENNDYSGIYLRGNSENNNLVDNIAKKNGEGGIGLFGGINNNLEGNILLKNIIGILLDSTSSNTNINDNIACGNTNKDFHCSDGSSTGNSGNGNLFAASEIIPCSNWPTASHYTECPNFILDCEDLQNMRDDTSETYTLMYDINCDGISFDPIGTLGDPFTGNLIGNYHIISNLQIIGASGGLFGYLDGNVENLGLEDVYIEISTSVGALAQELKLNGYVNQVYSTGNVYGPNNAGGLVGSNLGVINNSYSLVSVGNKESCAQGNYTGGLVGSNLGTISNSYYAGTTVEGCDNVGGLVGRSNVLIKNSFSAVLNPIVASNGLNKGGIVGWWNGGDIINATYNRNTEPDIVSCFGVNVQNNGYICSGVSPGDLSIQFPKFFYNSGSIPMKIWDFNNVWLEHSESYPTLIGFGGVITVPTFSPFESIGNIIETLKIVFGDFIGFNV